MTDNIQVLLRIRPINNPPEACLFKDPNLPQITILTKPEHKTFTFDFVADSDTSQAEIHDMIGKSLASSCLEGYNVCVFAYGQTGAGKTYTMQGGEGDHRGLEPRMFENLFGLMNGYRKQGCEFFLKASFLEIYNETIIDLLEEGNGGLNLREDIRKGPYVEGLKEEEVTEANQLMEIFRKGIKNRHVGETNMNRESSRSHSVFTLRIESKQTINHVLHFK